MKVNDMNKYVKRFLYVLLLLILVFLVYYVRIKNSVISIDTESFINNPEGIINSWYSIGRFSLGIYIELFKLVPLNMLFNNIVSLALYFLATLLLVNSFNLTINSPVDCL